MEDVLDVYARPYDRKRPLVCFDESNKEQHIEVITPLPIKEEASLRFESTFERNAVSKSFMLFAALHNWRHVKVTTRRTNADWAECMRHLVDVHFPSATQVVVVQDNMNTHTPA